MALRPTPNTDRFAGPDRTLARQLIYLWCSIATFGLESTSLLRSGLSIGWLCQSIARRFATASSGLTAARFFWKDDLTAQRWRSWIGISVSPSISAKRAARWISSRTSIAAGWLSALTG